MATIPVGDDPAIPLSRGITRPLERRALRRNDVAGVLFGVLFAVATVVGMVMVVLWPGHKPKRLVEPEVERSEGELVRYQLVGVEAFDAACGATLHREVCMQTLLPSYRAHSASAEGLTGILIASAAQGVAKTLAAVLANRGVNRAGFSGERVCHSTLVSSIEQLETALTALNRALNSPERPPFDEIRTRIRAATEFHTTCIDALVATGALEPHTVDAKQRTEKLLRNALAVVAALSQFGPNLRSWELTAVDDATNLRTFMVPGDGVPSWMSSNQRDELLMDDPPIDVLVAKDGSGKFKSIQGAIDAASRSSGSVNAKWYVIGIKAGVWNEQVIVPKKARNLMLVGAGAGLTVITGNRSIVTTPGMTTFFSPTLSKLPLLKFPLAFRVARHLPVGL